MSDILLTHAAVRKLAATLKTTDTSSMKNTEIYGMISAAFGWKPDAFMHALKNAKGGVTSRAAILPFDERTPQLAALGIERLDEWTDLISRPSGVFMTVGPTGSGKTTTLTTSAKYLLGRGRQVRAADDVVGAPKGAVVVYGEIRDIGTAEEAFRLAARGFTVLASMCVMRADCAVPRLLEIGLPDGVIDLLQGVMSQHLVRACCPHCRDDEAYGNCTSGDRHGRTLTTCLEVYDGQKTALRHKNVTSLWSDPLLGYEDDLRLKLARGTVRMDEIDHVFGSKMVARLAG